MYMDGYFLKKKKKSGVVFYTKESMWWLWKQGFFLKAASRYLKFVLIFLTIAIQN